MKKKKILMSLALCLMLSTTFTLTACDSNHEHVFNIDKFSDTSHWSECECGVKTTEFDHWFQNACDETCEGCDFTRETSHNFGSTYQYDDNEHWQKCSTCPAEQNRGNHEFESNFDTECGVCGKTREVAHTYADTYTKDLTHHWFACTDNGCQSKSEYAEHSYENGICVCGDVEATEGLGFAYDSTTESYILTGMGTSSAVHVRVPETYDDGENGVHPVTKVGVEAFDDNTDVQTIILADSITYIDRDAFTYCLFTTIHIGPNMTSMNGYPFAGCINLLNITIDEDNPKYHAEGGCIIDTAAKTLIFATRRSTIPADGSVTIIGSRAFYEQSHLKTVVIPEGVTTIESYAFYSTSSYSDVIYILPTTLKTIEINAFNLAKVSYILYNGTSQLQWLQIDIVGDTNINALTGDKLFYYSETSNAGSGNFWHYVDGTPMFW